MPDTAELVAKEHPVDLNDIEHWSITEEKQGEFERIKNRLIRPEK